MTEDGILGLALLACITLVVVSVIIGYYFGPRR